MKLVSYFELLLLIYILSFNIFFILIPTPIKFTTRTFLFSYEYPIHLAYILALSASSSLSRVHSIPNYQAANTIFSISCSFPIAFRHVHLTIYIRLLPSKLSAAGAHSFTPLAPPPFTFTFLFGAYAHLIIRLMHIVFLSTPIQSICCTS